jgi:hypothetical protein
MRALLVRQARAEVIKGFNSSIEMIKQRNSSKTAPDERSNQIEIAFAEREPTRRIRLLVSNAYARRDGAGRMTLDDWREVEKELTQTFADGVRMRRRWCAVLRRLAARAPEQRCDTGPTSTRE